MDGLKLFFSVVIFGLIFELVFFHIMLRVIGRPFKTNHKYSLGKNVSLMSIPIWGLIALIIYGHYTYAQLFLLGALVGTFAEYAFGRFFYHIEGKRVWTYNFASIRGCTSFLSIPYWGGATLLFVLIAKLMNL